MTVYQFRLFDSYTTGYPLLGVVSTDGAEIQTQWVEGDGADPELGPELDEVFPVRLAARQDTSYAELPPTEILRYNLPYLSSANEEFPDFEAAAANAQQVIEENQNGEDYQAQHPAEPDEEPTEEEEEVTP
jgi:hypothetical protein